MIGWLEGNVLSRANDGVVVLNVNGVGYELQTPNAGEVHVGDVASFFVKTMVRTDAIVLFGFRSLEERAFFDLLLEVPGVGPSTAVAFLRSMSLTEASEAIRAGDAKKISTVPGIGAKTASRVCLELEKKVSSYKSLGSTHETISQALLSLGFARDEADKALRSVELPEDESEALRIVLAALRQ